MTFKLSPKLLKHFKGFCSSPEVIMLFVYMKCRFSLSYRELEEIANMRGLKVDRAMIQRWVVRFARLIDLEVRKNKRLIHGNWRMDETYIKVKGKWAYLYRALDSSGNTIDFLLRKHRDITAAMAFFHKTVTHHDLPVRVTIDKSGSNIPALNTINKILSKSRQIAIQQSKYLNNIIEQDHRFIKKRIKPMLGFKSFRSAQATISGIESIRMIQKGQISFSNMKASVFENFKMIMI
jgi:putative transposase